jgi:hypothetical protein
VEPPSVEPRLQWPGPVKQPQQSSEAADRTSGTRKRSRAVDLGESRSAVDRCRGAVRCVVTATGTTMFCGGVLC